MNQSSRARWCQFSASIILLLPVGCGYGLMQTGFTEPPRKLGFTAGVSRIGNEIDNQGGRNTATNSGVDLGLRTGITRRMDIGAGPYFAAGGRMDVKFNVAPQPAPYAFGPRVGVGYAHPGRDLFTALVGGIGSYRWGRILEPYLAVTFANHWIARDPDAVREATYSLKPGERLVAPKGYGDGLLQTVVGLNLRLTPGLGFMGEYGHWFLMQNDPGDLYKFVATNVYLLGFYVHASDDTSGFM